MSTVLTFALFVGMCCALQWRWFVSSLGGGVGAPPNR